MSAHGRLLNFELIFRDGTDTEHIPFNDLSMVAGFYLLILKHSQCDNGTAHSKNKRLFWFLRATFNSSV